METTRHYGNEVLNFSGKGEIYSYTVVYDAPDKFMFLVPYIIALVKLEEGPIITAMLTDIDLDKIYIGMTVEMVTRKLSEDGDRGLISYGYKFRPCITSYR